ncbi:hypothetical protein GS4_25_00430 [Gordonia soli NBRC 108243]|uniref:Uncharacterized protein n=1 Tax=Gordonia soli NBRC 108243 TaxID=1223545 RepID=M0QPV5_9ACTN|nr:hypothetical protein GS4_25_00430 [Gordonia soli NBRC 108243]
MKGCGICRFTVFDDGVGAKRWIHPTVMLSNGAHQGHSRVAGDLLLDKVEVVIVEEGDVSIIQENRISTLT